MSHRRFLQRSRRWLLVELVILLNLGKNAEKVDEVSLRSEDTA